MHEKKEIKDTDITINTSRNKNYLSNSNKTLKEYTVEIIQHHLQENNFNVVLTAKKLGIGKTKIYELIKENLIKTT